MLELDSITLANAFFIAASVLIGLSFFLLKSIFKSADEIRKTKTRYEFLYIAFFLIIVRPVVSAYYFFYLGTPMNGFVNLFSAMMLFFGMLTLFFIVNKLRSLEMSYLAPTFVYLGVNAFFLVSITNALEAVSALFYVESFWFLSLSMFAIAKFAEEFDVLSNSAPIVKFIAVLVLAAPTMVMVSLQEYSQAGAASSAALELVKQAMLFGGGLFAACAFAFFTELYWFKNKLANFKMSLGTSHLSAEDIELARQKPVE